MMVIALSDTDIKEALKKTGGNQAQAARILGIAASTFKDRVVKMNREGETVDKPNYKETQTKDQRIIESDRFSTVDEALKYADVDMAIWEVERIVVNGWDVTMKIDDEPITRQNKQIKIWLRRRVPQVIADAAEEIMERFRKAAPKYPKACKLPKIKNPHSLEIAIFDHHFGKLAWHEEVGQDYDLKIAEQLYANAVDELLVKSQGYPIEEILLPIGQDFFHIDNPKRTTINDTPQDVDGRLPKIFNTGFEACIRAIDNLITIAPVKIIWVPGNHDRTISWFLVRTIQERYHHTDRVVVDTQPRLRKYHRYGVTLIGYTHGDEEKPDFLPTIMASEAGQDWADTIFHEWHLGHWHKRKEIKFVPLDTHIGVQLRYLPSLAGTDYWHHMKGYVNNQRAAEAYLWSKRDGYSGHFAANVKA